MLSSRATMRIGGWRFRPSALMTALLTGFCALSIALGNWQRDRAIDKSVRHQVLDERMAKPVVTLGAQDAAMPSLEWRRVRVRGEFLPHKTILLDNRTYAHRVGYEVLTPLVIAGTNKHVLVDRGWVALGASRADLPEIRTPRGEVELQGVAIAPSEKAFELKPVAPEGAVWQNLVWSRYVAASGLDLQPIVLAQASGTDDGLIRHWEPPMAGAEKHRMYMLQWYSFAVLAVVLYFILNIKKVEQVVPSARGDA